MTPDPGQAPGSTGMPLDAERARAGLAGLERAVDEALGELAGLERRSRDAQAGIRHAAASLAAIRASSSWRTLEIGRRAADRLRWLALAAGGRRRRSGGVPAAVRQAPLGVNLAGYIGAESGLGEAARASIRTLALAGIPTALNDVPGVQRATDRSFTAFSADNPHPVNLVHLNADNMVPFRLARGRRYFHDRYSIGFWFWELSRFRHEWAGAFRVVDEVWAATRFARDAIRAASPVPVVRMPLPVAVPEPAALGRAHFGLPERRFVFLFTFDVSSQVERKNPLAVVRAFQRSGAASDGALLVLKFTNGHFNREAVDRLAAAAGPGVVLFDGHMARPELNALVSACDCYVSLHRSEGFGLTMAEAMALGKPVVATAYSGNMDFMSPDTAALVGYRLVPLDRHHGPYPPGFEWAEPDVDGAAQAMRALASSRERAMELGRRGADAVRSILGPEAAAARYRRRLEAIRSGAPAPVHEDA
jgi:glycosyltransferase involved in cell wall biosynthesis